MVFRNCRSLSRIRADIVERGDLRRIWKPLRLYREPAGTDCTGEATCNVDLIIDA